MHILGWHECIEFFSRKRLTVRRSGSCWLKLVISNIYEQVGVGSRSRYFSSSCNKHVTVVLAPSPPPPPFPPHAANPQSRASAATPAKQIMTKVGPNHTKAISTPREDERSMYLMANSHSLGFKLRDFVCPVGGEDWRGG